ncbi:MAG: uncharacterized protein JWO86_467 [Myxococcaceae bacterium]|jgi:hypothetical protein|nr:uncharacterized protein [Myxococcaceae bacterium]MEA2750428.1 hypothetical protein [Myxococcales bacterium]
MLLSRLVIPLAVVIGAASLGGCYVRSRPEPIYATTEVSAAPAVDIAAYPSVVYEGRPVYLYNNRWYYRDGDRWGYYRNEPPYLERQRPYVQSAPPASRGYYRGAPTQGPYYQQPPNTYSPNPSSAPPATRVQ